MKREISVLVVDDHPTFRAGMIAALTMLQSIGSVYEAEDTASAIYNAQEAGEIDLAFVDLQLGEESGGFCTEKLLERFPAMKVIIMTAFADLPEGHRAMRAGAGGWLLKTSSMNEITTAIEEVMSGLQSVSASAVSTPVNEVVLSGREREVLESLAEGLLNKEIASRLEVSEATVKFHLQKLYRKLGVNDRTDAVVAGLKNGCISIR